MKFQCIDEKRVFRSSWYYICKKLLGCKRRRAFSGVFKGKPHGSEKIQAS